MLLYNVTVKVELDIENEWLLWMKQIHIPEVLATGLFVKNQLLRLISQDQEDGQTYAVQYFCESSELLDEYLKNYAPDLQQKTRDLYPNKFVAFRTVLEVL